MAYTFRDPLEATDDLRRRSPVHEHLQISIVRQEQGVVVLSMPLTENLRGPAKGSIHGGMLAALADAASGFCLEGCFELGSEFPVTTDMDIRYFRQPKGGPLVAEAVMVHKGRTLLSSECAIVDAEQRVLARSTATYVIVPIGDSASSPTGHKRQRWRETRDEQIRIRDDCIRELHRAGWTQSANMEEVGCSKGTVYDVIRKLRSARH